jgi:hypothetical protein
MVVERTGSRSQSTARFSNPAGRGDFAMAQRIVRLLQK